MFRKIDEGKIDFMEIEIKTKKIGNSIGAILPDEAVKKLNLNLAML